MDILSKSEFGRVCLQHFDALENGTEKFLSNSVKTKLITVLGQWLLANCRSAGSPSEEERRVFVDSVLEQLYVFLIKRLVSNLTRKVFRPVKLDKTVFSETLDSFVQNHQQLSCGITSNRKRQRTVCAIGQN
jgi:hypothetical protein